MDEYKRIIELQMRGDGEDFDKDKEVKMLLIRFCEEVMDIDKDLISDTAFIQ